MEWNLKGGSWDLTELDGGGGLPNIETTVDNYYWSSTLGSVNPSGGEFCVDLKLGRVGNSGTEGSGPKWKVAAAASKTASSAASGSSKRARAIQNGTQTASCLVDGCSSDLSNCREYHRRHKVCELHSKTPVVTIGGQKQRFCQQCSRFHSLEEFDEGKRSCRKRLDGHNRRRRKPQPVPLTRSAALFSNYQGRQLVSLTSSDSNLYPSGAMVNPGWEWEWDGRAVVRSNSKQQLYLGSSESTRMKHHEKPCVEAASACHTLLMRMTASSAEESPPPPRALSLLSSPAPTHAPIYLSQQPLGPTSHEAVDATPLVNNGTHLYVYNSFGSDASQGFHTSQSLPFHWE
ncbi:squamosa promoter-binding-like protein 13A [Prosopis cineraria]|uniref:squamosa promoter-binding-like protein 13A n=1 Tax=Prosopis cineraria TaxID=364024 RepID=UPI00241033D4|nr:squamosa promoter-binding-like protein 13A [Prosopis cineraria]